MSRFMSSAARACTPALRNRRSGISQNLPSMDRQAPFVVAS
jgi:hypothetical protein